jgi:acylglycerol lipase
VHNRRDRGNTGPTSLILEDIVCFIEAQLASPPAVPLFVMGHSMGGGLLATLASIPKYESLVSRLGGIMLEAPYIDLFPKRRPWTITVRLGRAFSRIFPHFQIRQHVHPQLLVRDQAVQNAIRNDRFMYPIGTLEMLANMLERAADLSSGKLRLSNHVKALYVAHGTADRLTSYDATKTGLRAKQTRSRRANSKHTTVGVTCCMWIRRKIGKYLRMTVPLGFAGG